MNNYTNKLYPPPPLVPLSIKAVKVYLEETQRMLLKNKELSYLREYDIASYGVRKGLKTIKYLEEDLTNCIQLLQEFELTKERPDGVKMWVLNHYKDYFEIKGHQLHFREIWVNESPMKVMYILSYVDEDGRDVNIYLDLNSISTLVDFLQLYKMLYRRRSSLRIHRDLELELSEKMLKESK